MSITDEQYVNALVDRAETAVKAARELQRRFRAWGLVPQGLSGVSDEDLMNEVYRRGLRSVDEGETPCVSCHRVGVHALNCPNRSVPVEGQDA